MSDSQGYYQESGRAGRDGEVAYCVLFYTYAEKSRVQSIIQMKSENGLPKVLLPHTLSLRMCCRIKSHRATATGTDTKGDGQPLRGHLLLREHRRLPPFPHARLLWGGERMTSSRFRQFSSRFGLIFCVPGISQGGVPEHVRQLQGWPALGEEGHHIRRPRFCRTRYTTGSRSRHPILRIAVRI